MTPPPGVRVPERPRPQRFWTVDEANARLEGLRELLPKLQAWVVRLRAIHEEIGRLNRFWGVEADAGDNPDRALKARLETEWEQLTARLSAEVESLRREGIEIKDLNGGLVDFYTIRHGEVVHLCWRTGEDRIGYFHTLEGGFRNRQPLDAPGPSRTAQARERSG